MKRSPMKRSKPKYQTPAAVDESEAWRGTQPLCWLCLFFGRENRYPIEVHEVVERSKTSQPFQRFNFAALCGHRDYNCHHRLQSRGLSGRLICWALKRLYDPECFDLKASVAIWKRLTMTWRPWRMC